MTDRSVTTTKRPVQIILADSVAIRDTNYHYYPAETTNDLLTQSLANLRKRSILVQADFDQVVALLVQSFTVISSATSRYETIVDARIGGGYDNAPYRIPIPDHFGAILCRVIAVASAPTTGTMEIVMQGELE